MEVVATLEFVGQTSQLRFTSTFRERRNSRPNRARPVSVGLVGISMLSTHAAIRPGPTPVMFDPTTAVLVAATRQTRLQTNILATQHQSLHLQLRKAPNLL